MAAKGGAGTAAAAAGAGVLGILAAGQFVMTLDSSVMNVSMATVAADVGTTITGIQTAITMYTLVMATLMLTGGKIGSIIGRKKAFLVGCAIYAAGSFTTGIAQNLPMLLFGWSLLEGMGAALILPAIVALVAANFEPSARPKAYGLVAAAGAIAVAAGPLIGGLATTYASWRYVFFGEVAIIAVILVLSKRVADVELTDRPSLDLVGTVLSVLGLGLAVFGILRSSEWGWVSPKPGGTAWLGVSPTFWLMLAGGVIVWLFFMWERHLVDAGRDPLLQPALLKVDQLSGGLIMFFFQFLLQAGVFFVVPLFLSVVLELSAIDTGLRIMPLSVALLAGAVGVPKVAPTGSPRRLVRIGIVLMLIGIVVLMAGIDIDASPGVVAIPMLAIGLGIGFLASQLGAVTVSAVPTSQSGEVGGLQNTATNLGASIGTALAGSVMIAVLTTSLIAGIQQNPAVPASVKSQASTELASGVPFLSDTDLQAALDQAGVPPSVADAVVSENRAARIDGLDAGLAVLALLAVVALFFTGRVPTEPVGADDDEADDPAPGGAPDPEEVPA
ncbi:MAG: MFS transporter [Acidimicrobiales bacterium]